MVRFPQRKKSIVQAFNKESVTNHKRVGNLCLYPTWTVSQGWDVYAVAARADGKTCARF